MEEDAVGRLKEPRVDKAQFEHNNNHRSYVASAKT